jgi:hypothetical protein
MLKIIDIERTTAQVEVGGIEKDLILDRNRVSLNRKMDIMLSENEGNKTAVILKTDSLIEKEDRNNKIKKRNNNRRVNKL